MIRLNNKGQSLFLFVIFIPIFMLFSMYIIDISYAKISSNKLNNISKIVINYGLKNINNNPYDNMVDLINNNDNDIKSYNIEIDELNSKINIKLEKDTDVFFGKIIGKKNYSITSNYTGYISSSGDYVIERGN